MKKSLVKKLMGAALAATLIFSVFTTALSAASLERIALIPSSGKREEYHGNPDAVVRVYDNEGPGKNYNPKNSGSLIIHAPDGYFMHITGTVTTRSQGYYEDSFYICDGTELAFNNQIGKYNGRNYIDVYTSGSVVFFTIIANIHLSNRDKTADGPDLTITFIPMQSDVVEFPVASDLAYGQRLRESTLTGGSANVPGRFSWAEPDTVPAPTDGALMCYPVVFTPNNSRIQPVRLNVSVFVGPEDIVPDYGMSEEDLAPIDYDIGPDDVVPDDVTPDDVVPEDVAPDFGMPDISFEPEEEIPFIFMIPEDAPEVIEEPVVEAEPAVETEPVVETEPAVEAEPVVETAPAVPSTPAAVTSAPAPVSASAPAPVVLADAGRSGVEGFVDRLYMHTLNRSADAAGREYWVDLLNTGKSTGTQVANGFFNSVEFASRNLNDEQFVNTLYKVFFDRLPDQSGFENWISALDNGMTRSEVISGFTRSSEWNNTCEGYGINA